MILGITGTLAAGKGTVVDFLKERGFLHYSVKDFLMDEINTRGLGLDRDSMVFVANELRKNHSPSYIIEQLYNIAKSRGGNAIIESLRNPSEINFLKDKDDFHLISVDADQLTRYQRAKDRGGEKDQVSFDKFASQEENEMTNEDPAKINLSRCIEMADFRIRNDGTINDLEKDVDEILGILRIETPKKLKVKIMKLHPGAKIPSYANPGDAGMDLYAVGKRETDKFVEYGTGLSFEIPSGYAGFIFPRSSVSKKDLVLANSVGVIDSGYRGEFIVRFKKLGQEEYEVGERVAQVVIMQIPKIEIEEVNTLNDSVRGSGGFGSSGTH